MLKTTTNYFVFLSAGKLSGRSQLMHFRKMLSAFSFLLFILVSNSQLSLGFKFNQQLDRIGAFRLGKRVCGNYYF